jgi:FtsZ-binding cell division protein ZapB
MNEKLTRFIDNTIGQFIEVSYSPALYQCYDLIYLWTFVLDIPKSAIQHQYAYEAFTQASDFTRQYFDIIPNLKETIPQEGDIVVWNKTSSNIAGHIAVVIEATDLKMKVFEQNSLLGTNAHIGDKGYTNCLGFLRPKFTVNDGIPQWLKTILQESGISLSDEGSFREIWGKALDYDNTTKSLQAQVISANEALSDRAMEVSLLTEKNQKLSDKVAEVEELLNKLRSDKDTLLVEKARLEEQVKTLASQIVELQIQVTSLKENNDLFAYSWIERFRSLFDRR